MTSSVTLGSSTLVGIVKDIKDVFPKICWVFLLDLSPCQLSVYWSDSIAFKSLTSISLAQCYYLLRQTEPKLQNEQLYKLDDYKVIILTSTRMKIF